MKIVILSGKGGTGKTMLAVNLAHVFGWRYVDCDVEAPNGFLFLKPKLSSHEQVFLPMPIIEHELCTLCQACVEHCQFNALFGGGKEIVFFEKLCHACGLCRLVCPVGAITETPRALGCIEKGEGEHGECRQGVLTPGEPMGTPIIDKLKEDLDEQPTILDAPPGSSCSVVATAMDVDLAVLVADPTPFGAHDLAMVERVTARLKVPSVIVINRSEGQDELIDDFAQARGIPIIARLPFSLEAARRIARGELLADDPLWRERFSQLGLRLKEAMACSS